MSSENPIPADAPSGDVGDVRVLGTELRLLAARFTAAARAGCGDDLAALAVLGDCEAVLAAVHAARIHVMAGMAPDDADDPGDAEFVAEDIATELGWGIDTARNHLNDAVTLTRRLPDVLAALEGGRLDLRKATLFADKTHSLSDAHAAEVAERVLDWAVEGRTHASLARKLRRAVASVDPHGCERRHQIEKAQRRVWVEPLDDGMAELRAVLAADAAMAVYRMTDAVARGSRVPGDERSVDARRADALVNLALGRRDPGTSGEPDTGLRPLVQVTVAASTLLGLDDKPGDLAGYGPVPAAFARRLASDTSGRWRRFLTDPRGRLVAVGRTYRPPPRLADYIRARDRHCRFPCCTRTARHADIDHTVAWPHGPTTPDNLGVLCRRHHRAKTRGIVRVQQRDGTFHWTMTRTGRRYAVEPENHDPP